SGFYHHHQEDEENASALTNYQPIIKLEQSILYIDPRLFQQQLQQISYKYDHGLLRINNN
ncbi:19877_t:CDS:2, partial [Entrophospora sp. SA101]